MTPPPAPMARIGVYARVMTASGRLMSRLTISTIGFTGASLPQAGSPMIASEDAA